jgi:hypothetical protein
LSKFRRESIVWLESRPGPEHLDELLHGLLDVIFGGNNQILDTLLVVNWSCLSFGFHFPIEKSR